MTAMIRVCNCSNHVQFGRNAFYWNRHAASIHGTVTLPESIRRIKRMSIIEIKYKQYNLYKFHRKYYWIGVWCITKCWMLLFISASVGVRGSHFYSEPPPSSFISREMLQISRMWITSRNNQDLVCIYSKVRVPFYITVHIKCAWVRRTEMYYCNRVLLIGWNVDWKNLKCKKVVWRRFST